jgi:hypothetical protein
LGVYFDPDLNFKFHISQIAKKLSRALYTLRQVKNFLPKDALVTLYYSLAHCHLSYASIIWGSAAEITVNKLFIMQKKIIRSILCTNYNAHTEPLFKELKILPLKDLIKYQKQEFMYNYKKNQVPRSLLRTWTTTQERRNDQEINLRNNETLYIPFARTDLISRMPLISLPKCWNSLPPDIQNVESKNVFKKKLKFYYLDQLSENYVCTRLFCPTCSKQD